eukprot:m.16338 g.16338  ORF g.16338 m.16338 type:complete len:306 (+) comp10954_c0_seq2:66-983(+)
MTPFAMPSLLMAATVATATVSAASDPLPKRVEIAPGVFMPVVNLGGVQERPSNYSAFLTVGGEGLDTALSYGPETQEQVGRAFRNSGISRDKVFITTKIPCCPMFDAWKNPYCPSGASPANASGWINTTIDLLGVEYVDLMLLHWGCNSLDNTLATYNVLESLLASGRAKAIGISNFNASTLDQLLKVVKTKPAVNQCGYSIANHNTSLLGRDDATREYCTQHGIQYQAYSPLGGLSGVDVLGNPIVKSVAAAHNVSTAQVALRWVMQQQAVFVTAAENPEYLAEDLDVFGFSLTSSEMDQLAAI